MEGIGMMMDMKIENEIEENKEWYKRKFEEKPQEAERGGGGDSEKMAILKIITALTMSNYSMCYFFSKRMYSDVVFLLYHNTSSM